MDNKYINELNPNEIVIIDKSESSRKSILMKHVTTMIEGVKSQQGFYKLNMTADIIYDNNTYTVNANEDSYQMLSKPNFDSAELTLSTGEDVKNMLLETTTLMVGQRYKLPLYGEYSHLKYIDIEKEENDWYKHTLDTITPIKSGIHILNFILNNVQYEKTFVIVPQPAFIGDVNNVLSNDTSIFINDEQPT